MFKVLSNVRPESIKLWKGLILRVISPNSSIFQKSTKFRKYRKWPFWKGLIFVAWIGRGLEFYYRLVKTLFLLELSFQPSTYPYRWAVPSPISLKTGFKVYHHENLQIFSSKEISCFSGFALRQVINLMVESLQNDFSLNWVWKNLSLFHWSWQAWHVESS